MAAVPEFKEIILIEVGDELFINLAQILSHRLKEFVQCKLEIEVELVAFLAHITESAEDATKDPLAVAAKRRAIQ